VNQHITSSCGAEPDQRPGRRRLRPVIAVVAFALVATACAGGDGSSGSSRDTVAPAIEQGPGEGVEPQPGGTLVVGLGAETSGWNPYQGQWGATAFMVANAIFDPLAGFDDDGIAHPYLAESFTPNGDFTVWEIGLRQGVVFHDGTPVDADAIATNLEAGRTSGLTAASFATVSSIDVVDDATVRVTMTRPYSTFPYLLAGQPGYMTAPSQLADPATAQSRPVGTGPFSLVDWVPDDRLTVARNEAYWRPGLPYLDGIEFRILTDNQSRLASLEAGEVDAIEVTAASSLRDAERTARGGGIQFVSDAGRETDEIIITLNTSAPPFDDPTAREAVAAAIDRDGLAAVNAGAVPPAWGPLAEGSPAYLTPEEAGNTPYDPVRARELATSYEQQSGQPLRFGMILPPDPELRANGELLQAQLSEAGIGVEIELAEQTSLISRVLGGDYQASAFALFSTPTLDRGYAFIATAPAGGGLSLNVSRYDDPELTAAMDEARATDDPDEQADAYREVQRRLAAANQLVFLYHRVRAVAFDDTTFGFFDTTFPGSDRAAYAGFYSTPFPTSVWKAEG
jgi:peptide/nickel transport system substrate-binding protein